MKNYTYLAPEYYKVFTCKADKCRHTCCSGWRIPVSKDEYNKLITMECSEGLNRRVQSAFVIPEYVTDKCYRYVSFNWVGVCPIQEKGLCNLYKEKGESYIPLVCNLFPRSLKTINGVNVACCSCSCERVVEMLLGSNDLNLQEVQSEIEPQLSYSISEDDVEQIKAFNKIIKDQSTTLAESIADICRIINKNEFDRDCNSDADALEIVIDLLKRIAADNGKLSELAEEIETRYSSDREQFISDKESFESRHPDWMKFMERLINNSMIYECFPFVDKKADKTRVYKGLCFCYGLLRLVCIANHSSSKEDLIDSISLLFHVIDHTSFYYNVSILSENAAVALKI